MARLNIIGFETGDSSEYDRNVLTGNNTFTTTNARTGYALRQNPSASTAGIEYPLKLAATGLANAAAGLATVYVRAYFRLTTAPGATTTILGLINHTMNDDVVKLKMTSAGAIGLYYMNSSFVDVQVGSSSSALVAGQYYMLELKASSVGTPGSSSIELKIDGAVVATGSSLTIADSAADRTLDHLMLGTQVDGSNTFDWYWDDIAIDDAAYPGVGEVHILKPNATGTTSAWTNGAGTSPTNVAEVPHDSDTSYITSSTNGNVTTVNLDSSATGGVSGTIAAVKVIGIVRDEGGASSMSIRAKSSATNSDTTAVDPGATYVALAKILTTDPNTSAAWTTSGLDALEIGVVNSASVAVRCTALYAMVECAPPVTATKDVASAAATSTTNTKDVTEDAALSTAATKDLAEDAAVSTTGTKDVASDASISTGTVVTLDLATAGVVSTTATKDLAEDAVVTMTGTLDLAEAAAVETTNTKDVTTDAVTTAPATKDVSTEAVVGLQSTERLRVGAALDDGHWFPQDSSFSATTSEVNAGSLTVTRKASIFARMANVQIPQGALILSAQYNQYMNANAAGANLQIHGNAADNAVAPTSLAEAVSAAGNPTAAGVSFAPSTSAGYQGADITTILQELVDRSGWAAGNAMMFFLEDNGGTSYVHARSYEYHPTGWQGDYAPYIDVTWAAPLVRRYKEVATDASLIASGSRDVLENAAISTTATKDLATDAATTAPATKDVAEDAALEAVVTLDLATDSSIGIGSTADVASDASTTAPATAQVVEDAAVETTVTLDLAEAAAVSVSVTLDLATDAALSTTGTLDVGADAAIFVNRQGVDVGCDACISTPGALAPRAATATLLERYPAGTATLDRPGSARASLSTTPQGRASMTRPGGGRASMTRKPGGRATFPRTGDEQP